MTPSPIRAIAAKCFHRFEGANIIGLPPHRFDGKTRASVALSPKRVGARCGFWIGVGAAAAA
jgi:hypothetical protein